MNRSGGDWYKLEQQWKSALNNGHTVDVNIKINREAGNSRPVSFTVIHSIDGVINKTKIKNR